MTDRRLPRSSIRPEEAEWLDATRLLLALATGRPMGAYNTVPEAARGVLSYGSDSVPSWTPPVPRSSSCALSRTPRATSSERAGGPTT